MGTQKVVDPATVIRLVRPTCSAPKQAHVSALGMQLVRSVTSVCQGALDYLSLSVNVSIYHLIIKPFWLMVTQVSLTYRTHLINL